MTTPSEIILALIGMVSAALAAWLGRGYTRDQKRAEAEAARLAAEQAMEDKRRATEEDRWQRIEADVARLAAEVQALRSENADLRKINADLRVEHLEAQDRIRDQDELIEDMLTYLITHEDWTEAGATPPPPALSWRVLAALRRRRAAMSGPTPTADDPTPKEGTP